MIQNSSEKIPVSIFWFRRDLRLEDNAGLYHALKSGFPVLPIFIFDTEILDDLPVDDARITFIYDTLKSIHLELNQSGNALLIRKGKPLEIWRELTTEYKIKAAFLNHDYEPYAIARDLEIQQFLEWEGIAFHSYKDQVIFEKDEVVKPDGKPYTVFTPYSRKWKEKLKDFYLMSYPTEKYADLFYKTAQTDFPELSSLGFTRTTTEIPANTIDTHIIENYNQVRDFPGSDGTSRLGIHLRFGTISIRRLARLALDLNSVFLNELIWREFYMMILYHFPHVVNGAFYREYNAMEWMNDDSKFQQWCAGKTGFPMVDAGMRELNATGYMHNRVRMIAASFLTKNLLIDWRRGEQYFAGKLLDFELASNNGGWQWAAGTGCDAASYFRIFSPEAQQKKFDPDFLYICKWIPEFGTSAYPQPIIDIKASRTRALDAYKKALNW